MEETTRVKIIKGAQALFLKYGIRSVSMDEVAKELSVSKKTLYQYFADKDELVTQITRDHLDFRRGEFEKIHSEAKTSIDELVQLSFCIRQDFEELHPSLLFDLKKFHQKAWAEWNHFKTQHIRRMVIDNLKKGIKEGNFRQEMDVEVMATLRLEMVQTAFNDEVFPRDQFKLAEVQVQLFEHFVFGLLTDKGRKLYNSYKKEFLKP